MERVTRVELALAAWEAAVLPLNYTRGLLRRDYNTRNFILQREAAGRARGFHPNPVTAIKRRAGRISVSLRFTTWL